MPSYGSTTVVEKQLGPASPTAVALAQTPTPNQPLLINGSTAVNGVAVLDTGRRIQVVSTDPGPHTVQLTGFNSQDSLTFETLTFTGAGTLQSYFDYATITSILPDGLPWSGQLTVGTTNIGSTASQIASHYAAIFNVGFSVTVDGIANCSIEVTRDIAYALPQIYVPDYKIIPPKIYWFPWTTLENMTANTFSDVDSPINAWRLTVNSGSGLCVARAVPVGLRT